MAWPTVGRMLALPMSPVSAEACASIVRFEREDTAESAAPPATCGGASSPFVQSVCDAAERRELFRRSECTW